MDSADDFSMALSFGLSVLVTLPASFDSVAAGLSVRSGAGPGSRGPAGRAPLGVEDAGAALGVDVEVEAG